MRLNWTLTGSSLRSGYELVQAAGFEPAKHYAEDLEPSPFDHSGTPARYASRESLLIPAARTPLIRYQAGNATECLM